jgi:hypothetical protein
MNTRFSLAASLSAVALFSGQAQAGPVTSVPVSIDAKVVTFTPYNGTLYNTPRLLDTVTEVGISETGVGVGMSFDDDTRTHILGEVPTTFGSNGSWPVHGAFAGLGQVSGYMTFTFATGMNFAGGLVNFDSSSDLTISVSALDILGDVIDTIEFGNLANPPGFYGFTSLGANADIFGLQFVGANIAVDNLTFGTTTTGTGIPEPASTALVLASLGALAFTRRRQR